MIERADDMRSYSSLNLGYRSNMSNEAPGFILRASPSNDCPLFRRSVIKVCVHPRVNIRKAEQNIYADP